MNPTFWHWIGWNISISVAIFLFVLLVLFFILYEDENIFFGIVENLFHIKRHDLDIYNQIIQPYTKQGTSSAVADNLFSLATTYVTIVNEVKQKVEFPHERVKSEENPASAEQNMSENSTWDNKNSQKNSIAEIVSKQSPSHSKESEEKSQDTERNPSRQRPVLNLYGKFVNLNKKNKTFILLLTTIVVSSALIAAANSIVLVTTSVYRDGPCPNHGLMECYSGDNNTHFQCTIGDNVNFPFDTHVGTCFRWVLRDITTSDLTTQLGVTAGLLMALGSVTGALIRFYLFALNKRINVASGIHRMAAKTIGINEITAPN
ncbi:unnamed protein product, partial [Rotaria sp. Silwood1]